MFPHESYQGWGHRRQSANPVDPHVREEGKSDKNIMLDSLATIGFKLMPSINLACILEISKG